MALKYLHSKDVVYMDLKPQNILIFGDWKVKLGDFGGAIKLKNDQNDYRIKSFTPKFASKDFVDKQK